MFRNHLVVAFRNLIRHKVYSVINIAGLAIGMACAVLILLWVQDELSYDRFHEHASGLYRVLRRSVDDPDQVGHIIPNALPPILARDYPEVSDYTRVHDFSEYESCVLRYGERMFYESGFSLADASFFEMFTFSFVRGNPQTALASPDAVVISERMWEKYFGDEDPLGKVIRWNNKRDLVVTGVVKRPRNSHLQFDFLARIELLGAKRLEKWYWECAGYVLLQENAAPQAVRQKIADTMKQSNYAHDHRFLVDLEPVTQIHLYRGAGDIRLVYVFSMIALLVLVIACVNYMNLTTARYSTRAREIGLRKVVGASQAEIAGQFFRESILTSMLSALLATAVVELVLPTFNAWAAKNLEMDLLHNSWLSAGLFCLPILVGVISGIYPALFLSSFQPVSVLKGRFALDARGLSFRKALVIAQFSVSIALIICMAIVRDQYAYMRNKELGFEKDHMVYIRINEALRQGYDAYRAEVLQHPDVLGVTVASCLPLNVYHYHFIDWEGKNTDERTGLRFAVVDPDYIDTFGIDLVQGRKFSRDLASDVSNFVINRKAAEFMGLASPIGKRVSFQQGLIKGQIIGVMDDFHIRPLSEEKGPLLLTVHPENYDYFLKFVFFRIKPEHAAGTMAYLKQVTEKHAPDYPFEYRFLDDTIDGLYRFVDRMGNVLSCFTLMAVFISCLGLFGLASFTAERRTREIGIRKALGASAPSIASLLSRAFIRLVILANIIAWPVAYYAMDIWLRNFAYRIHLGVGIFALSGALVLAVGLASVSYQAVKTALANPVDALRYE